MSEPPNSPHSNNPRKDPQPIIQAQIVFLVSTITEDNLERNYSEIKSLIEQHGQDNQIYFIRRLLVSYVNQLKGIENNPTQIKLLRLELVRLGATVDQALHVRESIDNEQFDGINLDDLLKKLEIPLVESLFIVAALLDAQSQNLIEQSRFILNNWLIDQTSKQIIVGAGSFIEENNPDLNALLITLLSHDHLDISHIQSLLLALSTRLKTSLPSILAKSVVPDLKFNQSKTLAQLLVDLSSTTELRTSVELLEAAFHKFGWPSAQQQTESLDLRASELFSSLGQLGIMSNNVDISTIMSILNNYPTKPSHQLIIRGFDSPNNPPPTPNILANILLSAPPGQVDDESPLLGLVGTWVNPSLQINAIAGLLSLPNDQFSFAALPSQKIITVDYVNQSSPAIKAMAAAVQSSLWNCIDTVDIIIKLQDHGPEPINVLARELLETGCRTHGEIILLGLVQLPKPWSNYHLELITRLLALFLAGNPSHQLVFLRLWQIDRNFLLGAFKQFYQDNNMNVTRILDVAQDLKILDQVLEIKPVTFAFDLAALASRREYLNMEKWLQNGVTVHGISFFRDSLKFLDSKAKAEAIKLNTGAVNNQLNINVQTVAMFLRVLRANAEVLPLVSDDIEYYKEVRNLCLQYWPRLMNLTPHSEQEPGLSVTTFSPDLDRQVEDYYHRMYSGELRVDEVIVFLEKCKQSSNPRDHELFAAMIHTLFEEYRHYETYPAAELALTGILFGSLIQFQVIDFIPLGIAIRYVLTALQSLPNTNRFRFGVQALSQFQRRLPEWPQVCQALLAIRHLIETIPDLGFYLRLAVEHSNEVRRSQGGSALDGPDIATPTAKLSFNTVKPDALTTDETEDYSVPDEETSDRILFIVNNLAPNNFSTKSDEMKERFKAEYSRWFAHYLVLERVSIEPNNHNLYMQFLESIDESDLLRHVLRETYIKVRELLNDDNTVSNSTDRSHLKNLGSWLGGLTLAKNKPIRHRNIAFKELLLEGFDTNKLIVAIPFVCKVLEQCSNSRIFVPPNPWLMAVLKLLVELYIVADLKLNLKFEIEVLCKSLGIEIKDIEPTNLVKNRPSKDAVPLAAINQTTPGGNVLGSELERLQMAGVPNERVQAALLQQQASAAAQQQQQLQFQQQIASNGNAQQPLAPESPVLQEERTQPSIAPELIAAVPNISQYLVFDSSNPIFANNAHLQRMMHIAIDRAIKEIIAPVVERSVTIASLSTRELIVKDFAMEGDETKMQAAAHLMAQNLAGNLSLVTCKEPLRISVVSHFRHVLHQSGLSEQSVPEQTVYSAVNENLDVACKVIEKLAMQRAIIEVDDQLLEGFVSRRKHRETTNQAYWDNAVISSAHFSNSLPDLLRIKPNGLDAQQLQVYEGFNRNNYAVQQQQQQQQQQPEVIESIPPGTQQRVSVDGNGNAGAINPQQSYERFNQLIVEIEKAIVASQVDSSELLPPNSELRPLVQEVSILAFQSQNFEEVSLSFAQRIVQLLYRAETNLGREVHVTILQHLCELSMKAAKEVTAWLVLSDDDRKFNVPVTLYLVKARLIHIEELDLTLSRSIVRDMRQSAIDFAATLIKESIQDQIATRSNFTHCLEALTIAAQNSKTSDAMTKLHQALKQTQPGNVATPVLNRLTKTSNDQETALRQRLALNFADWVRIYGMTQQVEKAFIPYISQLQSQGILKGEETSTLFFRICVELGVESFIKQKNDGVTNISNAFQPIDAFVKLVVLMIKYHMDHTGLNHDQAKQVYLNKIISITSLVIAQSHEDLQENFEQKPFYRLYSSLLIELWSIRQHLGVNAYKGILVTISNSLANLQPAYFPRFAHGWVSLISHRNFLPIILALENHENWIDFHRLMTALLRFVKTFTSKPQFQTSSKQLYRATQRILLLLLHDFSEYLSEYYGGLIDVIPSSCTQLRNLVLSAYPRNAQTNSLPDPFLPSIDIESMPQSQFNPTISSDYMTIIINNGIKDLVEQYTSGEAKEEIVDEIIRKITDTSAAVDYDNDDWKYNVPAINSVVLFIGVEAITHSQTDTESVKFDGGSTNTNLIMSLINRLDAEGRYLVLSAIANQLRFPSSHTYWFNRMCLKILEESSSTNENVVEILTRVLLERLLVTKPHPWGLLLTFFNVFLNPEFKRYQNKFSNLAPEFATIFDSVEKSFGRAATVAQE
ncbi:Not1-domain-containing protein [Wallemia mellicola]|nr:Not1-domain-containing protein [Wallemia mellicola]